MQQIVPHRLELTWEEIRIELQEERTMVGMNIKIVLEKGFVTVHIEKEVHQYMKEEVEEMVGKMTDKMETIGRQDHLITRGMRGIVITDIIEIEEIGPTWGTEGTHCSHIGRDMMIDN